ncbi:hypothetical protein [Streptomyces sp. NPDC001500]
MPKKITALAAALFAAAVMAGCSSGDEASRASTPAAEIHLSRSKDYTDLTALAADSTAVVKVTAGSSTGRSLNDVPTTVTQVRVNEVVSGTLSTHVLSIQQLGNSRTRIDDAAPILKKGQDYLLFVRPFHLTAADDTGLYSITGGRGEYVYDRNRGDYRLEGGETAQLPAGLSASQVSEVGALPLA